MGNSTNPRVTKIHPATLYKSLQEVYIRYYDTAFGLRDIAVQAERRELLQDDGVLFTEPLLEPVPGYDQFSKISKIGAEIGLSPEQAELLSRSVFNEPSEFRVRKHQQDSLKTSFAGSEKRNVIVTAGTGAGKTESFLLPVFARLIKEGWDWPAPRVAKTPWWIDETSQQPWEPL